jgi:hypothetical protein
LDGDLVVVVVVREKVWEELDGDVDLVCNGTGPGTGSSVNGTLPKVVLHE